MKLADAANVMAIRKGTGLNSRFCAVAIAIGASRAAAALFDMISVNNEVTKYIPETIAIGPHGPS